MEICSVSSNQLLQRWQVPSCPFIGRDDRQSLFTACGWGPTSKHLVLPFEPEEKSEQPGLMFLSVQTGVCTTVLLGHTDFLDAPVLYHTGRGLVLAQHTDAEQRGRLSVYTCQGDLVASTSAPPTPETRQCSWAPSGRLVALSDDQVMYTCPIWLWDLTSSPPVLVKESAFSWTAWATPCQARMIVGWYESEDTSLVTLQHRQPLQGLSHGPLAGGLDLANALWGSKLALLSHRQTLGGYEQLLVYSLQGTQLVLEHIIALARRVFVDGKLLLSGDGELCAALTGVPATIRRAHKLIQPCLALVHLESGRVREFPLQPATVKIVGLDGLRLTWSADCTAVLASGEYVLTSQLFSFA